MSKRSILTLSVRIQHLHAYCRARNAMPNQLSIPFKKTYVVPIREAVRDYILSHHLDTHPDAYRWDISRWEKLRAEAVSNVVHVDRVKALIRYDPGSQSSSSCELLIF